MSGADHEVRPHRRTPDGSTGTWPPERPAQHGSPDITSPSPREMRIGPRFRGMPGESTQSRYRRPLPLYFNGNDQGVRNRVRRGLHNNLCMIVDIYRRYHSHYCPRSRSGSAGGTQKGNTHRFHTEYWIDLPPGGDRSGEAPRADQGRGHAGVVGYHGGVGGRFKLAAPASRLWAFWAGADKEHGSR